MVIEELLCQRIVEKEWNEAVESAKLTVNSEALEHLRALFEMGYKAGAKTFRESVRDIVESDVSVLDSLLYPEDEIIL